MIRPDEVSSVLEALVVQVEALAERSTGHSARLANHLHEMQEGKAAHEEYRRGEGYGMLQESRMAETLKARKKARQEQE